MGYGTTKGGIMHVTDAYTGESEVLMDERDYPYQPAVSYIDESNLKKIAQELGISYVHMDRTERIESTLNNIKNSVDTDVEEDKREGYAELYYFFMIPLAVLVAYEFISVKRRG